MIEIGTRVGLRKTVKYHSCPEGRENNRTAVVVAKLFDSADCLWMDRDLRGCRGWNEEDVYIIETEEK